MKKLLQTICALCTALTLCACSAAPKDEKGAVESVVNSYFTALQSGDFEKVNTYMTSDADNEVIGELGDFAGQLEGLGLSESVIKQFEAVYKPLLKRVLESWTIDDVTIDGDSAKAKVTVKGIDLEKIMNNFTDQFEEIGASWSTEHLEKMQEQLASGSQQDFMNWLYEQIIPVVAEQLEKMQFETGEMNISLSLVKEGDSWKIAEVGA